ncbi:MAG TPA: hypothetical protein RMH99_10310 [Sandaracinaceae bacterium LLY-WYZ-13_1]|nr:hypothetical protein [Sandaracinaceae bacterium LLY-WYZ-13_1]
MRKAVITLTVFASLLCMLAVSVEAQRGRRGRRGQQQQRQQRAPNSEAIERAMGDLEWGMEPRQVHEHFVNRIRESYRERLSKAPGAIEEDRIRHEMNAEIRRLRESYVRFEGDRTGWDLSFLRGEFTHGNRESMLVYRDDNSQNFYFFIQGRLWKWYKAFDANVFRGRSFDQFAGAVQGRFGEAVQRQGSLTGERGGRQHRWLEWQDSDTRLRAIDQTRFYGFYCLVFEDKSTLDRLDELRTNTIESGNQGSHALVDSIVRDDEEGGDDGDAHADIVDRITGNIRRRPSRDEGASSSSGSDSSSGSSRGSSGSRGRSRGSSGDDSLDLSDL